MRLSRPARLLEGDGAGSAHCAEAARRASPANFLIQFFVVFVLLAAVPTIVAQIYAARELADEHDRAAASVAMGWANFAASDLEQVVESVRGALSVLAVLSPIRAVDKERCGAILSSVRDSQPVLAGLGIFGLDGRPLCAPEPVDPDLSLVDRDYFRRALESPHFVLGDYQVGRLRPIPLLPLALRFNDEEGRPAGVLVAPLRIDALRAFVMSEGFPSDATLTVVGREDGRILLSLPDSGREGERIPEGLSWLQQAREPGTLSEIFLRPAGPAMVAGYVPVMHSAGGLMAMVAIPRDLALAGLPISTIVALFLASAELIVALVIAYFVGRRYVDRPIEELGAAAQRWAKGDYGARARADGIGRLQVLADTFNHMAEAIEERERTQKLIAREFNHRTKNALTTVLALARQGKRAGTSLDAFLPAFETRIHAYAKAHDLLSRNEWRHTTLQTLIREIAAPYSDDVPGRVEIGGNDCDLAPEAALAVSLILGELCTNASKYGAFSIAAGRVAIHCAYPNGASGNAGSGAEQTGLVMTWRESGGPIVTPAMRVGFGSRMLCQLAESLHGTIDLKFPPTGAIAVLSLPRSIEASGLKN